MKLPRQPAAVIFDMDGLLFDTEKLYGEAILSAAAEVGCAMSPDVFHRLVGTPWHASRVFLLDHYGPTFPVEELRVAWMRHFDLLVAADLPLKTGVLELLDLLDELRLPRAIATSSSHRTVQHHLAFHRLADRFHRIVAHGDYATSKPAPDPFLKAAEWLGVAPELCLALEDSHNGIRSASTAGMMTIMVPDLVPATDEMHRLCMHVVVDLHEVHRLVDAGRAPLRAE
jgi:HAD superfamily hydrolase (TIGR01509 family)